MTFYDHASELQHVTGCHDMPRYATYHFVKILGSVVISVISPQDLLAKIAIEKSKDTWSSAKAEEHGGDFGTVFLNETSPAGEETQ